METLIQVLVSAIFTEAKQNHGFIFTGGNINFVFKIRLLGF